MSNSLPVPIDVIVPTNGYEAPYYEFENLYPPGFRNDLAVTALAAAQETEPNIAETDIWASGFSGDYSEERFEATDKEKLDRHSSAAHKLDHSPEYEDETGDEFGFDGDDSNEPNIIERDIHAFRQQKLTLNRQLADLESRGELTPSLQAPVVAELRELNDQIKKLQAVQAANRLPVYYATSLDYLRHDDPEDNPLAYMGSVPGIGYLALYDGRAILSDPALGVSYKSEAQIRIAGRGLAIMRHALAVVRLNFVG